jgi:uncharacterized membrane protein YhaH (DUF805 family)
VIAFGRLRHALTHPHQYSGRATRGEFWTFQVLVYLLVFAVAALTDRWHSEIPPFVAGLLLLPSLIAVTVRRLHDVGRPGNYAFYALIPIIGTLIVWGSCAAEGNPEDNEYGPPAI